MAGSVIHADDTPLVLLRPLRTAYAWVYLGDAQNPYTLFDVTAGRSQTFPQRFLAGYRGFVHADGYDGYNAVHGNVISAAGLVPAVPTMALPSVIAAGGF